MEQLRNQQLQYHIPYQIELRSDIGCREEQQDRAYYKMLSDGLFAVVCDGMGGTDDGALASETAIRRAEQLFNHYLQRRDGDTAVSFLRTLMAETDAAVSTALGKKDGGTTELAVYLEGQQLFWLSVGDSRLYIYRNGELLQATRDHNYRLRLDEQMGRNEITESFYHSQEGKGEALISYVGMGGISTYDLTSTPLELKQGDILLLCSDGLYKVLPLEMMRFVLSSGKALNEKADLLISQVLVQKERVRLDNTTFILVEIR